MKKYIISLIILVCFASNSLFSQNLDSILLSDYQKKAELIEIQMKILNDSLIKIKNNISKVESILTIGKYTEIKVKTSLVTKVITKCTLKKEPHMDATPIGEIAKNQEVQLIDFKNEYWLVSSGELAGFLSEIYVIETPEMIELKTALDIRNKELEQIEVAENTKKLKEQKQIEAKQLRQTNAIKVEKQKQEYKAKKERLTLKYDETIANKILNGYYWIGMTDDMTIESLGKPDDINRNVGTWGVHEQWIYKKTYLYFQNGKLTSYQN